MTYDFSPIKLEDKERLDPYFLAEDYENSELCFSNMFLWKDSWHIEVCIADGILLLRGLQPDGERFFFPPVMKDPAHIITGMTHCMAAARGEGKPFVMYGVTQGICELMQTHCASCNLLYEEDRNNFDYVYKTEDLIELPGSRYHAKRNHINRMRALYDIRFEPMNDDLIDQCRTSYKDWYARRVASDDTLIDERAAMELAFNYWRPLGFEGGALLVNGRVQAFSFGERRKNGIAVIHIEKANTDYPGLYALINQQMAENVFCDTKYLNREEDMGIPGLRKAKLSYHPARMIVKYIVREGQKP